MTWWEHLFHPSMWEWGDVATWFTGIVTAGSLWLAILLLRGDRKREERSQAAMVAIVSNTDKLTDQHEATFRLMNYSSQPIFFPVIVVVGDPSPHFFRTPSSTHKDYDPVVLPGQEVSRTLRLNTRAQYEGATVMFRDTRGLFWAWRVRTGKVSRAQGDVANVDVTPGQQITGNYIE